MPEQHKPEAWLCVDLDGNGICHGWDEVAVDPPFEVIRVTFERRAEDGLYYGPAPSSVLVDRSTGRIISVEGLAA